MEFGDVFSVMNEDGKFLVSILQEQVGKIDIFKDIFGYEFFNFILWMLQKFDVEEKSVFFFLIFVVFVIMKYFDEDFEIVIVFYEKEFDYIL